MKAAIANLKQASPEAVKTAARGAARNLRRTTAGRRPDPGFLIIGAQKAGTTSLHAYLGAHPEVSPSTVKEVHYFDLSYGRGRGWYRAHFRPLRGAERMAGESSPYYLYHPLVPRRVADDLPEAKLIAVLRNPVDRAFSHHNHERTLGFERLTFEVALEREDERLEGERERLIANPQITSFAHQHYSYLDRGRYAEQLETWFASVDPRRVLVLSAEDLFDSPAATLARAQEFLELEPHRPADLSVRNGRRYSELPQATRASLGARFGGANEALYRLLDRDLGWG
ncbi:MAG TPA: sulfotransferase domain-containing protein [Solirubrobacterales bacterium]|jgi:hypothetical protein